VSEAVNHDYPPDVDIDHTLFMFESRRVNGNRGLQNIRNTRKSTPLGAGPQHTSKKQPKVPRLFQSFSTGRILSPVWLVQSHAFPKSCHGQFMRHHQVLGTTAAPPAFSALYLSAP
jgi:hypothetical protein